MDDGIRIRRKPGRVVVVAGGAVLGETEAAFELSDEGIADVIYIPRGDLAMVMLDPSPKRTTSPTLGEAVYFSIQTSSLVLKDAAWSYEAPSGAAAAIAGYVAFRHPKVNVIAI